ncbi:MAG TPA: DUF348 domain-containing protein [Clostridiaceae bacterium]|nr:DUF348 domain-containing protein [Clostridiaceae bacterium]
MIPLVGNIKRFFLLKKTVIVFVAIAIIVTSAAVVATIGIYNYLQNEVVINDDGKVIEVKTFKTTVGEVLEQNGISLNAYDCISLPLDAKLQRMKVNEINIERAIPVNIIADGKQIQIMTCKDTIGEVLEEASVSLGEKDRLDGVGLDDKIAKGMEIKVIRVKEEFVEENIAIPYETERRENKRMDKGKEVVVREGKEGLLQKVYRVVTENGKEVLRELVKESIISNPVSKIVEYGTVLNYKTSRGDIIRYKKVLNMKSTAYTSSYEDTGKTPDHPYFGMTYTGIKAKKGVVAVDPKVIPLGTRLYIEVPGSAPDYGFAIAADIGSAVKGNKIDLYMEDVKSARSWGVRPVKVYILLD